MKKLTFLFSILIATIVSQAQNVTIPDAIFKSYLINRTDSINTDNTKNEISVAEAKAFKGIINVANKEIHSLQGIEAFTNLTSLDCSRNLLTSLDVSTNTALRILNCQLNQLTALDISKNTSLVSLSAYKNEIAALDVSHNLKLTFLNCFINKIATLDVSSNKDLKYLSCFLNNISHLDVSSNPRLKYFSCFDNYITSIDVSKNPVLDYFDCGGNKITSLDVSKNLALTCLYCGPNKLTSLDVSKNTNLKELGCWHNNIKTIDVSKNKALHFFKCYATLISKLDVSKNNLLTYLRCDTNQFLYTITTSPSQKKTAWEKDITTTYTTSLKTYQGDFPINAKPLLTTKTIHDTITKYSNGRNSVSTCTTTKALNQVSDCYYTFIADNPTIVLDVILQHKDLETAMELIDTFSHKSLNVYCANNTFTGQLQRTYSFTDLTVGQKYILRLELENTTHHLLEHSKSHTFSITLNSSEINKMESTKITTLKPRE